jgi:hypothetical protein
MKVVSALAAALLLLAVAAPGADRTGLRRSGKGIRTQVKKPSAGRSAVRDRARSVLISDGDVVLPYILNGDGLRSRIHLMNLDSTEVDLELYFVDDEGFGVEVDLKERGAADTVKVRIAPHGTATLETSGQGDNPPAWAFFDAGTARIGASVSLDITDNGVVWGATYSALHYADQRVSAVFDNTSGSDCEISIVSISDKEENVTIVVRDADGKELHKTTAALAPYGAMGFTPAQSTRAAINIRGSVEAFIEGESTGGVGVLSVQFYDQGGINFLPGFTYLVE